MSLSGVPRPASTGGYAVGVAIEPLRSTEIFRVGRWRCVVGAEESTAIQTQRWPMMSFTHFGAFVVHSGGRAAVIDPTSTLLVNPHVPYRMSRHYGERSRGAYVLVRPDVFREISRPGVLSGGFASVEGPSSTRSYLLEHALLERIDTDPSLEDLEIDETGIALVEAALAPDAETDAPARLSARQEAKVQRARAVILEHLSESLKLDDVARAVGLSPFHLCRVFRRATGRTLHRYRHTLRLRVALDRISEESVDLAQLALDLGFSSHSHFTAAFRKEFGASPSRMRHGHLREIARAGAGAETAGPPAPPARS